MENTGKQFVAEFIGTLLLVYIGAGSAMYFGLNGLVGVSLAFGFIVAAVVYTLGNISGAHINPAVTIALWAYGLIKMKQVILYIIAQVAGAIAAALLMKFTLVNGSGLGVTAIAEGVSPITGMIVEIIATFILVLTVFGCAVGKGKSNFAGLIIGLVVAAVIFTTGGITNTSINPARSIGPALIAGDFTNLWVYIVGPIIGGLLAAGVFKYLDSGNSE
ncbi:MAG: hypothetical protein B0D92_07800 [Spirochaeta sp. LUC14_002_19_P3]|nr:MAG: hypothetical protein B0D92_07800 [Spirochaeta sp. LUC14_002_19_P3]